jgi:hypothetical protein
MAYALTAWKKCMKRRWYNGGHIWTGKAGYK